MKVIITFFILFFSLQNLKAECSSGFIFYPKSHFVYKNTNIIIEAYGWGDEVEILKGMDEKFPIYLKNEKRKISLKKIQIVEGEFGLIQVILKPETTLVAGESYELEVQCLSENEQEIFHDELVRYIDGEGYQKLEWTAKDEFDFENPFVASAPKFSETEYIEYGCGPAVFTKFDYQVNDKSSIFVLTEVVDLRSNETRTYYVAATNNQVSVGHDMCMGGFLIEEGKKYKVRFKFYDINGNTDDKWTHYMKFKNPYKHHERKY